MFLQHCVVDQLIFHCSVNRFSKIVNVCILFWIGWMTSFDSDFVMPLLLGEATFRFFGGCVVWMRCSIWYYGGEETAGGEGIL